MKEKIKLFIVGLDGATFDLILPWIKEGHLPFLKKLLSEGTWGELESSCPPLTAPAWASFMTGKTTGNHGIFDFFYNKPHTYTQSLHSILDIKDQIFWDILGSDGRTVGLINLPLTYPPQAVNGFMISGLLTPYNKNDFTYPPKLLSEIEAKLGSYLLHHDQTGKLEAVLQQEYEILNYRTKAAHKLLQTHPKDFFMVHYYGTDRIQHEFWHLLDPTHPLFNEKDHKKYKDKILGFYRKLDKDLQTLSESLDDDTIIMVMSDHGFGPIHKFMNVNSWLVKEGFMRFKKTLPTYLRRLIFALSFTYSNMAKLVLKLGLGKKAVRLGRGSRQKIQQKIFLSLRDIDWIKTVAYSAGNFGQIYINKKGREPRGIVPRDNYEKVCRRIKEKLLQFIDPETKEKIIDKVFQKEEIFKGKYLPEAPDIFFLTKDMKIKPNGLSDFTSRKILEPAFASSGHHRFNGIFLAYNPRFIKKGCSLGKVSIVDLAPTILYALGSGVPDDMNGKVLIEIFKDNFLKDNPVHLLETKNKGETRKNRAYSEKEEDLVKKELKGLGYI